jgi:hypothetical protein
MLKKDIIAIAVLLFAHTCVWAKNPKAVQVDPKYNQNCRPLGELKEFWRNAPALGPYHEGGHRLIEIPDYMLKGDFPYQKKKTEMEVPFADHLSLVRLLGGFDDFTRFAKEGRDINANRSKRKSIPDMHLRDLAYRKKDGKIAYRWNLNKMLNPKFPILGASSRGITEIFPTGPEFSEYSARVEASLGESTLSGLKIDCALS